MRIFSVMLLLMMMTGCAAMLHINPPPEVTADRSWVPADAVVYGQDLPHGFFRFALNQAQPEPLGNTAGFLPEALYISPDKSVVYADANGPNNVEPHYIFNTKTRSLHDAGNLVPPYSLPAIAPDLHYIAWMNMRDPGLHVVDLQDSTVREIDLPGGADRDYRPCDMAWTDGDGLLAEYCVFGGHVLSYWKIDPATGTAVQIGGNDQSLPVTFMENGKPLPAFRSLSEIVRLQNKIFTSSGAVVYISKRRDLVVKYPNGSLTIVETHIDPPPMPLGIACDCGPGSGGSVPAIWGVFDGDVVLYSFGQDRNGGQELWVYGIAEHKKSSLPVTPIEMVF